MKRNNDLANAAEAEVLGVEMGRLAVGSAVLLKETASSRTWLL